MSTKYSASYLLRTFIWRMLLLSNLNSKAHKHMLSPAAKSITNRTKPEAYMPKTNFGSLCQAGYLISDSVLTKIMYPDPNESERQKG